MKIISLAFIFPMCLSATIAYSQAVETLTLEAEKKDTLNLSLYLIAEKPAYNKGNLIREKNPTYDYVKSGTIGTEISGSFYNFDYPILRSYGVSLAYYSGASDKRIRGIGELSKQYQLYFDKPSEYNHLDNNLYYAPGISIFSKNRKYSLDLFQSFSSDIFKYGNQNKSHYKFNFRF